MNAVVVLRGQVRDEVGASPEARGGLGVADELVEPERDALGLQEPPLFDDAALDDGAVRRRDDAARVRVDGPRARPQPPREEVVEAAVFGERLLCFAGIDAVDRREPRQHGASQRARQVAATAPPYGAGEGPLGEDPPDGARSPIAKREPTHEVLRTSAALAS